MQINAFYGADAYVVGQPAGQTPVKLAHKTPVKFLCFSAGILGNAASGDRVVVETNGTQYSVLASQVADD